MPRETTPQIEVPVVNITTVWPGANPEDVEQLITNKIEQEIKNVENIKEYASQSLSGLSIINIEFDLQSDQTENLQQIRDKVNIAERKLPASLPDQPNVQKISFSDFPILALNVSGDFSWSELKRFSKILEEELSNIPKVKRVTTTGAPESEVHIYLNPILLEQKSISISEVLSALRSADQSLPLGSIELDGEFIEITVQNEVETIQDFLSLPITRKSGATISLGEIAKVRNEFGTFDVETYYSSYKESKPSVLVNVIKSASNGNVITMVDQVFQKIQELKENGKIPEILEINPTYNRADEINKSLDTLTRSGGQTLFLIIIVMLIFVGWRESLLAATTIPLSLFIGIIVMKAFGETFNGVSLFALVIGVGLLVDTAIVIVEGVSEAINDKKLSPYDAAIYALQTFRWPLITGTLTTVFAFFPLILFIDGISGQFIRVIPITVTSVLLGALFVSLWILPNFSAEFFTAIPPKKHRENKKLKQIKQWYEKFLRKILLSPKKVFRVIGLSVAVFIGSVMLVVTGQIPIEVFPGGDRPYFYVDFEFPVGTSLEETKAFIPEVEKMFEDFSAQNPNASKKWIKNLIFTAGSSQIQNQEEQKQDAPHILGLTVNLVDEDDRTAKSYEMVDPMRAIVLQKTPSFILVDFTEEAGGPPSGAPIEIRLTGDNIQRLEEHTQFLSEKLAEINGIQDISDSRKDKTKQMIWSFDRRILNQFDLSPAQVIDQLRTAVNGTTAFQISQGDEEIDVKVRIDWTGETVWENPKSLDILNRIPIKTPRGTFIKLEQIASPKLESKLSQIDHFEGERIITITGSLTRGKTASQFQKQILAIIDQVEVFPGETIELGGDSEEGNLLIEQSAKAMLFALLLIFILLVTQFNSFSQPFIILSLIPLSLTGVFVGFWIFNQTISFPSMIGIVSLAGIIVNDAIVLIDQVNRNLRKNLTPISAYIQAGKDRMQPIFLTSVTTVIGMLPLSLSDPMWQGLGFSIIFGMLLSTILCLILVPVFLLSQKILAERITNFFYDAE